MRVPPTSAVHGLSHTLWFAEHVANVQAHPLPPGGNGAGAVAPGEMGAQQNAGALNRGSVTTSAVTKMFTFLAYLTPIYGGIVADNQLGRFKTICIGTLVGAVAHIILIFPALPSVIQKDPKGSLAGFIISIIVLAFAAGFIKPSLGPLLCDQSPVKAPTIKTTKKGERVIIDPQFTVSNYLNTFYLCINIGALFQLATQYAAHDIGFWLAFLLPGILYMIMPLVLVWANKRLVKLPPSGSVIPDTFRVIGMCIKKGGILGWLKGGKEFWERASPTYLRETDGFVDENKVHWDDKFVEEVRQTMSACGVFMLIPIFVLADPGSGGLGNTFNDMSVGMTKNGVPNDLLTNFNSIAIIVASPLLNYFIYPFFVKIGYPIKPMMRMSIGFVLGSLGCVVGAYLQDKIYKTSPCGKFASSCMVDGNVGVSPVSLWLQIPVVALPAIGEIFVNVTSYELAYTRAPPSMRGLVYSLALFNSCVAAAISMAVSSALTDPNLVIPWIVVAAACFACAFVFPTYFRHLDDFQFEWTEDERAEISDGKKHDIESSPRASMTAAPADHEKF